jgi:glutathione synthase/RimK-type ligase-like ATP-grasp enzyme
LKHIAFVTYAQQIYFTNGDDLTAEILREGKNEVEFVSWDDPLADWASFDAVILRSTWDYHKRTTEFTDWLGELDNANVNLWNRYNTVRWNMNKGYLEDLAKQGNRVPQTRFVAQGSAAQLQDLVDPEWPGAVLKPTVSASADDTYRFWVEGADELQGNFEGIVAEKSVIVQEFMPEIQAEGEWSLIFFNKQYSHAVLKQPSPDDFRVQLQFGGEQTSAQPPLHLIEQATNILNHIDESLLYARVDGVNRGGTFILMELELIEPYLFLEYDGDAARRFAEAILRVC